MLTLLLKKSMSIIKENRYNPLSIHIGQKIRLKRKLVGKTQSELAEALGVTFQQIQKYEKGSDRVKADQLYKIAVALNTPVAQFFTGYKEEKTMDANKFSKIYQQIKDPVVKKNIENIMIQVNNLKNL